MVRTSLTQKGRVRRVSRLDVGPTGLLEWGAHGNPGGARAAKADGGKPAQSATTTPGGKHVRGATPPAPARRKKPCLDLVSLVVSLWYFAVVAITTAVLMYASRNGIAYDAYFAMVVARMPLLVGTL